MKKTKYVAISAVVAVFVALALVSSATAVPITNSQPINESLQRRERMNDILNRFDAEKLEQKMNTNLFRRFNRGGAIEFDAENYTKEDIEREMRNLFDVEAIQQMIEEADMEELDDEQIQGIFDDYDGNFVFLELFAVFVGVGMILFGQNIVGFYIGYITALIVLIIPMYVSYVVMVFIILISVAFLELGDFLNELELPDDPIKEFGLIGTMLIAIIVILFFIVIIPIYLVFASVACFFIALFATILDNIIIHGELLNRYGF
jgi:hypothetical protein